MHNRPPAPIKVQRRRRLIFRRRPEHKAVPAPHTQSPMSAATRPIREKQRRIAASIRAAAPMKKQAPLSVQKEDFPRRAGGDSKSTGYSTAKGRIISKRPAK